MQNSITDLIQVATQGHLGGKFYYGAPVDPVAVTSQEIHVLVQVNKSHTWILFSIYASNNFSNRQLLWNNLQTVHNTHSCAWLLYGDFNEVSTSNKN